MKKQFLTMSLLATVAIGGAFASQSKEAENRRSVRATTPVYTTLNSCTAQIECSDQLNAPCRENVSDYYLNPGCTSPTPDFIYEPQ